MARVKPNALIQGLSGKIDKNANEYLYHNRVTGKTETRHSNYNRHRKPTQAEIDSRLSFKAKKDAVVAWFDENKPSDTQANGTPLYQQWHKAFFHQPKKGKVIGTFYSYVWHQLFPTKK